MATQIQLTRSGSPGAQPTATEMELGELALNYADGKLYFKNDSNNIEQLNSTYNNSGQKIYVNEADNHIGLNTILPEFLLDLGGGTASGDNTLRLNQNDDGTAIRIGGSAAGDITLLRVDNADGETDSTAEGFSIKYLGSNNHELGIFADNTSSEVQALTVLQDGKVGINTPTPVAELDVTGDVEVSGTINSNAVTTTDITATGDINLTIDTINIAAGAVTPDKLSAGGPTWDSAGNFSPGGISTYGESIEINISSSGDRNAYIDFHTSDTYSSGLENDYHARLIRDAGENGDLSLLNTGTGTTLVNSTIDQINSNPQSIATKAYVDRYRPGEMIEGFSALCNGRSVTLVSGTYTIPAQDAPHIVNTAPLSGANEFTLYNGAVETAQRTNNIADANLTDDLRASIIKYKLPAGAKRVCYEFHHVMGRLDSYPLIEYSVFIGDGAGTDSRNANVGGDETYTRLVDQAFTSPYAAVDSHITVSINLEITDVENEENVAAGIIYRGNWPAGGRTFVVNADSYGGSYDATLYASTHQDGASDVYFTRPYIKMATYA
jgi:hypothetical protein